MKDLMQSMTSSQQSKTEIILAHDSFTQLGGAERLFVAMHELYPQAPVYTLVVDKRLKLQNWNFKTSPLQWLYNLYPHFQHLFPLIPVALALFRVGSTRVLLSTSSSFIKGLRKPLGATHINYCHTPTRFLWVDQQHAYDEIPRIFRPLAKLYMTWLKRWDLRAAQNVDVFIANSKEVQQRIKQYYHRDSELIHPFVDVTFWQPTRTTKDTYFLVAGRLQRAKGIERVIQAFNELGLPLHVVGTGRYESELRAMAKPNITFLGRVSDQQLRDEYSDARGFIYPQFEDFGMMPLEAASCGTATLGLAQGGSLETIIPGVTGELLPETSVEAIKTAVQNWDEHRYELNKLQAHATTFSKAIFQEKISKLINHYLA